MYIINDVLFLGACGRAGAGIAVGLTRRGAKLALIGDDQAKLQTTAERCLQAGPKNSR